jgi:outer membrane lipoprotein carrier protein
MPLFIPQRKEPLSNSGYSEMNRIKRSAMQAAVLCLLFLFNAGWALDLGAVIEGMQRRYSAVSTIRANFRQTYRAPGIEQIESGAFWLKKPGLMRWEYRQPEEKLFIADGKQSYLYTPQDKQVIVQSFTLSDMHSTPLEFLLGAGDISKSFVPSWETEFKPRSENSTMVRLTPRENEPEYAFLVLEIDRANFDLHGIVIREHSGNTSRFEFTDLATNIKVGNRDFEFKVPKGVEEVRLTDDQ